MSRTDLINRAVPTRHQAPMWQRGAWKLQKINRWSVVEGIKTDRSPRCTNLSGQYS